MTLPPRSPFSLIQEDLFPDEWSILVACCMLNCTSRKQVDRVLPEFRHRWPTAHAFLRAGAAEVEALCRPLGFAQRRTAGLFKMSTAYVNVVGWTHARELPGIGKYAARAWEIFCCGVLGEDEPDDGSLAAYWRWRKAHEKAEATR